MIVIARQPTKRDAIERVAGKYGHHRRDGDYIGVKQVEASDMRVDAGRLVTAIANTAGRDLDDEVVLPDGADTTIFFRYRTIYWNHDYNLPIGSLESAAARMNAGSKQWVVRFKLASTPLARDVQTLIQDGAVRGVSIGFIARDYGKPTPAETALYGECKAVVRKWMWTELSVTPMPANPDALIRAIKSRNIPDTTIKTLGLARRPKPSIIVLD